ncbi:MAG: hypothetical protein ACOYL5_04995 [Phototrophicaceae bacterium]|jgi:hypothetical protein
MRRALRVIFYLEALINCISIVQYLFLGDVGVRALGITDPNPFIVEGFRAFGVLVLVLTYVLLRTLISNEERALRFVLEGYLLGDFVYIWALWQLIQKLDGVWTPTSIAAVVISVILMVARITYLWMFRAKAT